MLKQILKNSLGSYVPFETHIHIVPKNYQVFNRDKTIVAEVIDPHENIVPFKDYMLKTFYREAPIPSALNLSRNCDKTKAFLEKEIKLFINSGVSLKILDCHSREIVGIGFSVVWKRNTNYEVIGLSAKDWHNMAAVISKDYCENQRHLIWRELQYQHIYDLGQIVLRNSGQSHVFYLAMLYLNKEVRSSQLSDIVISIPKPGCSLLCQSNFRGFDKTVYKTFKNPIILDEVKYSEEKLVLNERGDRAFQPIDHLDGLRFFADY